MSLDTSVGHTASAGWPRGTTSTPAKQRGSTLTAGACSAVGTGSVIEIASLEARLRTTELRFQAIEDHANCIVVEVTRGQRCTYVSEQVHELTGFTPDEFAQLVEDSSRTRYHPDDRGAVRALYRQLARDVAPKSVVARWQLKAGTWRWFELLGSRHLVEGQIRLVLLMRDVHARESARRASQDAEARYRAVEAGVAGGVIEMSGDLSVITYVSPGVEKLTGFSSDELFALATLDRVHDDEHDMVTERLAAVAAGHPIGPLVFRWRVRSEDWRWIEMQLSPFTTSDGEARVLAVVDDVSDREEAQRALRQSETRLQEAQRIAQIGSWEWDARSGAWTVTASVRAIYGWSADPPDLAAQILGAQHPSDRAAFEDAFAQARGGAAVEIEHRIQRPNGVERVVHTHLEPVMDLTGHLQKLRGTTQDVTARALAAAALQDSEARARRLARERQELVRLQLSARESERRDVAHDLHDGPAQNLAAAAMLLEAFQDAVPEGTGAADQRLLGSAMEQVRTALHDIRHIMADLRPAALDDLGLVGALRALADTTTQTTGLEVTCLLELDDQGVDEGTQIVVYRVAQESVANAVKHAGASTVTVRLQPTLGGLRLVVEDDGAGLAEAAAARAQGAAGHGLGLVGMRERACLVGGTLSVEAGQGRGTRVELSVPLAPRSRIG